MCHVAKSLGITEHAAIDVARMGAIVAHGYVVAHWTVSLTPYSSYAMEDDYRAKFTVFILDIASACLRRCPVLLFIFDK